MDVIAFDPEVANDVLVGKTLEAAHLPLQRLRGLTHRIRWLPAVGNLLHSHELAARRVQTEVHAAERAGTDHLAALPRYGRHHERAAAFDLLGALREPRPMPFGSDCFVYDVRRLWAHLRTSSLLMRHFLYRTACAPHAGTIGCCQRI